MTDDPTWTPEILDRLRAFLPCPTCGGHCAPECGQHPAGCLYGGFSHGSWLIVPGCPLAHDPDGEEEIP